MSGSNRDDPSKEKESKKIDFDQEDSTSDIFNAIGSNFDTFIKQKKKDQEATSSSSVDKDRDNQTNDIFDSIGMNFDAFLKQKTTDGSINNNNMNETTFSNINDNDEDMFANLQKDDVLEQQNESASKAVFNRPINQFFGDSIVLGCGRNFSNRLFDLFSKDIKHGLHANASRFYSIDIDEKQEPDCQCDIGANGACPATLKGRFNFVFLENLTNTVYLDSNWKFRNPHILNLMDDDGVMLITGITPINEEFISNQLYIKESVGGIKPAVLVVKGPDNVSPLLVIKSLNPDAQTLINKYHQEINIYIEQNYDQKANEDFIRKKAVQLIKREIERSPEKKSALQALSNAIATQYPQKTLTSIIEGMRKQYSQLKSSAFFSNTIDNCLNTLSSMENYHLRNIPKPNMGGYNKIF